MIVTTQMEQRPPMVGNVTAYSADVGEGDLRASAAALGQALGLERLGVNHETIPPGCRSSIPHAHSHEEEFIFIIEGHPDLWIDGTLHRLRPGDAVAFPSGTGIAHSLLNNTNRDVTFLVIGENHAEDKVVYPVNPGVSHKRPWSDAPHRRLGGHNGKPSGA